MTEESGEKLYSRNEVQQVSSQEQSLRLVQTVPKKLTRRQWIVVVISTYNLCLGYWLQGSFITFAPLILHTPDFTTAPHGTTNDTDPHCLETTPATTLPSTWISAEGSQTYIWQFFEEDTHSFTAKGEPSSGFPSYNKRGKRLLERCADARNRALPVKRPPVQQEGCCCLGVYRVSLQPGFSNNQRFRVVPTVFPSSIISYRCNTCLAWHCLVSITCV